MGERVVRWNEIDSVSFRLGSLFVLIQNGYSKDYPLPPLIDKYVAAASLPQMTRLNHSLVTAPQPRRFSNVSCIFPRQLPFCPFLRSRGHRRLLELNGENLLILLDADE